MKINTKFNLGEVVWVMRTNKPQKVSIISIEILINPCKKESSIKYLITSNGERPEYAPYYRESNVFHTKEALIASL